MSFRILSLDGGGLRGIISARILKAIEGYLAQPLRDYFDLIIGTSTGAIMASGLMVGKSADQLLDLYLNRGNIIFPYHRWFSVQRLGLLLKYGLSAPKFPDDGLVQVIQAEIGLQPTIANVSPNRTDSTKLMITSYDTVRRSPVIFKSWRHEEWYASVPLWEACVCSSSAPSYFPAHRLLVPYQNDIQEYSMIDGGVGANNPVACAVAESIRLFQGGQVAGERVETSLDRMVSEMSVLSIGTGELAQKLPWQEVRAWGAIQWAPRILDVIMDAPADIHRYIAEQIVTKSGTEHPQQYLRLQPELKQKFGAIDNADRSYLMQLLDETEAYLAAQAQRIEAFFSATP